MKLFLYEWTCAAGGGLGLSEALSAEGWAMLAAVAADFGQLPNVQCLALLADTWPHDLGPGCIRVRPADEVQTFRQLAAQADFTLVIAPECDNILLDRCRMALNAGGRLLGPLPEAVALTGDKLALAGHWRERGVPTPETSGQWAMGNVQWVCKPRFGAGSQATFLIAHGADVEATMRQVRQEIGTEMIVQLFVPGTAASVAFLAGPQLLVPLLPGYQHLSADGRFHYLGGEIPLPPPLASRAVRLGRRAVEAVPGLQGYVGVDVILGEAADGSEDVAIEINPRLTTSYIGLRQLAQSNLAQVLLAVVAGRDLEPLSWKENSVRFQAAGQVRLGELANLDYSDAPAGGGRPRWPR